MCLRKLTKTTFTFGCCYKQIEIIELLQNKKGFSHREAILLFYELVNLSYLLPTKDNSYYMV